ncbi:MAG: hypothetical protein ACK4LQ_02150 [Pararhodobacter sp.]
MLEACAYDDLAALAVFRALDPHDLLEAQHIRGASVRYPQLFAEWHGAQAAAVLSLVLKAQGLPFAVLLVGNTGQAGVAQAAMLARDHARFRPALVAAAREIRTRLPAFCARLGVHRIEVRAWAGHPRAGRFLRLCGFQQEAEMTGFGAVGAERFLQFAWIRRD